MSTENDFSQEDSKGLRNQRIQEIESRHNKRWDFAIKAQSQLLSWIFTIQGVGLTGSLAYMTSSNHYGHYILYSILLFASGLLTTLLYGAVYFLLEVRSFNKYRESARGYIFCEYSWNTHKTKELAIAQWYTVCIVLGVLSFSITIAALIYFLCTFF